MNSILRWPNGGSGRQQVQSSAIVRQLSCHCLCHGDSMMISFHFNRRAVTIPSAGTNMCIFWIWSDMVCVVVSWTCVHVCVWIAPLFYIYLQSVPPLMWALAQNLEGGKKEGREGGRGKYNEKERWTVFIVLVGIWDTSVPHLTPLYCLLSYWAVCMCARSCVYMSVWWVKC